MPSPTAVSAPLTDWNNWNPRDYFDDYFGCGVNEDERAAIPFQIACLRRQARPFNRAIEFGCGPTLMRAIAAAPYVKSLDVADRLPANLDRVRAWIDGEDTADDWGAFTDYILRCEGSVDPGRAAIDDRERQTRTVIGERLEADALDAHPLGRAREGAYDLLISSFCLDCLTDSRTVWRAAMRNVLRVVKPGGTFLMWALRGCTSYRVGERWFPAANLQRRDLYSTLIVCGADPRQLQIEERDVYGHAAQGYAGVLMAAGTVLPLDRSPSRFTSRSFAL